MSVDSLELLLGAKRVGSSTLDDIEAAGFDTVEEVGVCTPAELSDRIDGVGYSTAVNILKHLEEEGYRTINTDQRNREQLVSLLEELFEFGRDDLDFGVYKLMNQKREQVEQFINEELVQVIEESVQELEEEIADVDVEQKRQKVVESVGEDAFLKDGSIDETYQGTPVVNEYLEAKEQAESQPNLENTRAEIYNYVYQFFNRYYENGDFITQRHRTQNEPPYSVPYDGSNTHFHWVTRNQYYAKTSEEYARFSFKQYGVEYIFRTEAGDVDGDTIGESEYFVMAPVESISIDENSGQVEATFYRRQIKDTDLERCGVSSNSHHKQEKMNEAFAEELANELRSVGTSFEKDKLVKKLKEYTGKNQRDFFIHRNLGKFLKSDLEDYIKTEIMGYEMKGELSLPSDHNAHKAKVVGDVSLEIIEFLSQLEDFKKKMFEKVKFATKSYQLVPVGNISDKHYQDILENDQQMDQWASRYSVDVQSLDEADLQEFPHCRLMVDTSFYSQNLLGAVPRSTLVKGENQQALDYLSESYQEEIKTIYIDPPYNTGEDGFPYKDGYNDASWLSMMYDRLKLAHSLLRDDGVLFVSIDNNEVERLMLLLNSIFGEENMIQNLIWENNGGVTRSYFQKSHEYILAYAKDKSQLDYFDYDPQLNHLIGPDNDYITHYIVDEDAEQRHGSSENSITFPAGSVRCLGEDRIVEEGGKMGHETAPIYVEEGRVVIKDGELAEDVTLRAKWLVPGFLNKWIETGEVYDNNGQEIVDFFIDEGGMMQYKKKRGVMSPDSIQNWPSTVRGTNQLKQVFGYKAYPYPKPVEIIKDLISLTTGDGDIVLDFFSGSGTTGQAVAELNHEREDTIDYILIEVLEEAFGLTEERVARTSYSNDWKDGEPNFAPDYEGGEEGTQLPQAVQCIHLESYEAALDAVRFSDNQSTLAEHSDHLLNYSLNMGVEKSATMVDPSQFAIPNEYELQTKGQQNTTADIMTTFNYLIGLQTPSVRAKEINGIEYTLYEGETAAGQDTLVVWRHNSNDVNYGKERDILNTSSYDKVYVNGDSALPDAAPIGPVFKDRMFK